MDLSGLSAILLDADNTLFDFDLAQKEALLEAIGLPPRHPEAEETFADFKRINDEAWREHEGGRLSREEVRTLRFSRLFGLRAFGPPVERAAEDFLKILATKGTLFPGVAETLAELRAIGLRLGLATNGFTAVQRGRLDVSGILPLLDGVFISEELGLKKPDSAFFAHCLSALGAQPSEALMVGDSPAADIAGGKSAGMACAWINPHRLPYPCEFPNPDFELASVNELPRALGLAL